MSNYNETLQSNNVYLQTILDTVNKLPNAGGEQATPVISVSQNGLITATAGTKTSTHQLAFQPAKTITPSTASQIAVSSGYYTGGSVTVAGDSNLVAGNIKNGVSIFGVSGNYTGSGGDTSDEDDLVTGTISRYSNESITTIRSCAFAECRYLTSVSFPVSITIGDNAFFRCNSLTSISFPKVTTIKSNAFCYCTSLKSVSFPVATTISDSAFYSCASLTSVSFPKVTTIGSYAFCNCKQLTSVSFPVATTISSYTFGNCTGLTSVSFPNVITINSRAFYFCTNLTSISFPKVTTIGNYAFERCYNLKSLYLTRSSLCKLSNSNAFYSTPIGGYSATAGTYGSIYVPTSLLASYKAATNWTYFSSRFVGI